MPFTSMITALFPTLAMVLQLVQVLNSVNGRANIHALHGMLYITFALFLVIVAETAIIHNYATLSSEEPRWWWRVWFGAAAIGVYTFIILVFYLMFDLTVEYFTTLITYFTACFLVSSMIAMMAASLAMVCAFRFNLGIYARVKLQ